MANQYDYSDVDVIRGRAAAKVAQRERMRGVDLASKPRQGGFSWVIARYVVDGEVIVLEALRETAAYQIDGESTRIRSGFAYWGSRQAAHQWLRSHSGLLVEGYWPLNLISLVDLASSRRRVDSLSTPRR
jgi:hypothetical protein